MIKGAAEKMGTNMRKSLQNELLISVIMNRETSASIRI